LISDVNINIIAKTIKNDANVFLLLRDVKKEYAINPGITIALGGWADTGRPRVFQLASTNG
jgi:hypothetical protein